MARVTGLCAGFVLLGCAAGQGGHSTLPLEQRPLLTVGTAAEESIAPDSASVAIWIEAVGADSRSSAQAAALREQAVLRALQPLPAGAAFARQPVEVTSLHDVMPERIASDWHPAVTGRNARIAIDVTELSAGDAYALARRALASGATTVAVDLHRRDCHEVLGRLRVRAVERAHRRARAIARGAGTELGSIYRVKEEIAQCPIEPVRVLHVRLRPDEAGAETPAAMLPDVTPTFARYVRARVAVILVHALASDTVVPSGQAPGEVHLGFARTASRKASELIASVGLRVRMAASTPGEALQRASAAMDAVTRALLAAGVSPDELRKRSERIDTRTAPVARDAHLIRATRDYVGESRIQLTTKRVDALERLVELAIAHGASGVEGPAYAIPFEAPLIERAAAQAAASAVHDAHTLARAADQSLRATTQIRADTAWLSEQDPLRAFIEDLGTYHGRYASGLASASGWPDELQPDEAKPIVKIVWPQLSVSTELAIGFALDPM